MKRSRFKINWFNIVVCILSGYFIYTFIGQQMQINSLDREVQNTRLQIEALNEEAKKLTEERERLNSTAYIEKIAREELGLVKPGEVPYVQIKNN